MLLSVIKIGHELTKKAQITDPSFLPTVSFWIVIFDIHKLLDESDIWTKTSKVLPVLVQSSYFIALMSLLQSINQLTYNTKLVGLAIWSSLYIHLYIHFIPL